MDLNKIFSEGLWCKEINVSDFVSKNITPYLRDKEPLNKVIWKVYLKIVMLKIVNGQKMYLGI